jgi:hypothetical protein
MSIGVGQGAASSGVPTLIAMISAMLLLWSFLIGPQLLRQDFRHDLPRADILKMYPMPGWQIAFGELLAPAVILTGFQWLLLILAIGLAPRPHLLHLNSVHPISLGLSAALILPMLNMITLQIPNASVLLFPAWFQTARDGASQGIEATGQRLIFMLGQLLVFVISMIPASGTFALVFFLVKATLGLGAAIPLAAIAAAIILGIEAALGIVLLGWLFDRFDVAAESSP